MKHVIEVPAGHTVQISRRGNRVTVESAESNDQLSPVGGWLLAGSSAKEGEIINTLPIPKVYEPGIVVVWSYRKPYTSNESIKTFLAFGPDNAPSVRLNSERKLDVNPKLSEQPQNYARQATPAEREEFLNNLRDWYGLMITESGELVNWRAEEGQSYYFISTEGDRASCREGFDSCDTEGWGMGNYFPEGFLTDERLTEYKATVQKLFNKWRGLCSE